MKVLKSVGVFAFYSIPVWAMTAFAESDGHKSAVTPPFGGCENYGPQAPRDIDSLLGEDSTEFRLAMPSTELNLCNIHLHTNAEHKAKEFSIMGGEGDHTGYQCTISTGLTTREQKIPSGDICGGLKPGDTIEVHWVHTSCNTEPGAGLGSCSSQACLNPELRVEAQVFTLVNDSSAMQFSDFDLAPNKLNGKFQPASLPISTGAPVEYLGSTTGPKYNDQQCSPYQVTWSVRPQCAKLDINSLGKWCKTNKFDEHHAHGVRKLVVNPSLISTIK